MNALEEHFGRIAVRHYVHEFRINTLSYADDIVLIVLLLLVYWESCLRCSRYTQLYTVSQQCQKMEYVVLRWEPGAHKFSEIWQTKTLPATQKWRGIAEHNIYIIYKYKSYISICILVLANLWFTNIKKTYNALRILYNNDLSAVAAFTLLQCISCVY